MLFMNLNKITSDNIEDIKNILETYGVAILENYFTEEYADQVYDDVKEWLINIDIGLTNDVDTWITHNMPMGPRYGMYQSIVSNAPTFWELREQFHPIFSELLDNENLITSIDGASFYPAKYCPKKTKEWPHIDQTESSEFMCYQSQFVAADTSASFVCTPKSHIYHEEMLKKFNITSPKNWHKFTDTEIDKLKKKFKKCYQIPIHAKKGSVIFWDYY